MMEGAFEPQIKAAPDFSDTDQASLARLVEELQKSKAALEARQFIEAGLAHFADVMRWRADDTLPHWVDRLLEELMQTIGGLHAALYLKEETENNESYLRLVGAYAFIPDSDRMSFRLGEGLIGQVGKSQNSRYLDDPTLIGITTQSSLADLQPAVLKIEALVYNEELQGVLEVSSIDPFKEEALQLLKQLSSVIAANLLTIQNQERTQRLYKEMQENALTLAAHEEEMRKNLETVTATQQELQEAKNEIEYRQKQMERITGNVPGMLFQYVYNLVTQEEGYTFVSERSKNILYLTPQEVVNTQNAITDRIHPEDKDAFIFAFKESREKLMPLTWTGRIITPEGGYRWIRAESSPTNDTEYLIVWDGYLYDITFEKEREIEQARQQQQLGLAALMAELGFMEIHLETQAIAFSDEMCRIFQLDKNSDLEDFFDRIHPEDRNQIISEVNELKNRFSSFNHEYRIQTDDKTLWIKSGGRVLNDQYNKPERALIIVQDITLRMQRAIEIEEKNRILEASEEELQQNLMALEAGRKEINDLLERQNLLFQSSRDAIWIIKDDITFDCNPAFLRLFQFQSKEEALKCKVNDLLPPLQPSGDDSMKIYKNLIEDCQTHGSTLWEWKNLKRDGQAFDAEMLLSHFDYKGEAYIQATIRDISERKTQQAELLKRQMQMELAENLGRLGAFEIVKENAVIHWSRSLVELLELKERSVDTLEQFQEIIHDEDRENFVTAIRRTMDGEVSSISIDFRVRMNNDGHKWFHMTVVGTYNESWELVGLEGMCQDITNAKERENIIQKHNSELETREEMLRHNVDQLEIAQKELKNVSERQNLLFETARDAILIMDNQTIVDCNPAAMRMFDVPLKEYLIKRKIADLSPEVQPTGENSVSTLNNLIDVALVGGNNKLEWVVQTYKGVPLDVEISMSPFIHQGKMMMQTTVRDITHRKARERAIRGQKALIESLIASSRDQILVIDEDLNILLANATNYPFLNPDCPPVSVGQSLHHIVEEDQKGVYQQLIQTALSGEAFSTDSWQIIDGKRHFYEIDFSPVRDAEQQIIGVSIVASEITERKQREIDLLEEEFLRNQSEEIGKMGTYLFDVTTGIIKWSKGCYAIFGLSEDITPDIDMFMNQLVFEDDRQPLQEIVGKAVIEGIPIETNYRITANGQIKYMYSYIRPIKDVNGNVVRLMGLNHDVTQYQSHHSEDSSSPPMPSETTASNNTEQITALEKEIRQMQKQNRDLQSEFKLMQKKVMDYKEKEMSLLEIIQVKDQEIDQLRKKLNRG